MAGSLTAFKEEVSEEVATILASDFEVVAANTQSVPHSGDAAITFPNLDAGTLKTKVLTSCVLYIDIRRSTELNIQHKPKTVSKLYSAFVRAMTRCAQRHNGHVRGIIGDRVMVLFDAENCFTNAVETAISMNSVATYVINKHFTANEVTCGIGIDYGRMLVTKTGFRRHGHEQQNYRSLVWLGRPANVASKLTDLANKAGETRTEPVVHVAQKGTDLSALAASIFGSSSPGGSGLGALGLGGTTNALASVLNPQPSKNWQWRDVSVEEFVKGFERNYSTGEWRHKIADLEAFFPSTRTITVRPTTPAILMTQAVYDGFKAANPASASIKEGLLKPYRLKVPGYTGNVFGGGVIWKAMQG